MSIVLYIDDLIISSNHVVYIAMIKVALQEEFEMTDMGLGLEIEQTSLSPNSGM